MSDISKVCDRMGDQAAGLIMKVRLGDLDAYFLRLHCCRRTVVMPVRLILTRQPQQRVRRLGDILSLLKCDKCKGRPAAVWLAETHSDYATYGEPPGWSVQLVPCPAIEAEAAE